MQKAEVLNGVVVNIIEVNPSEIPPWCADWPDAGPGAEIGGSYEGGAFLPRPTPPVDMDAVRVTMSLTFAQLLIGLVAEGWITRTEGEAWLAGTPPAAVAALIATLPVEQQFAATARALRPSIIMRLDPLVVALGFSQGKTAEQVDAFFAAYSVV